MYAIYHFPARETWGGRGKLVDKIMNCLAGISLHNDEALYKVVTFEPYNRLK